jgi:exopolysaccharide production protein ExoY
VDGAPKRQEAVAEAAARITPPDTFYVRHGKRALDVALGLALLPVLLPVMAIIALGMAHRGNIIYGHRRVGRLGETFTCYKFRTMVVDADERLAELLATDPAARTEWERDHKLSHDPRITRLGRVLRKTSLDELPQIWNVLRGEMSFVGPRPVTRAELTKYDEHAATYLSVKPGVTGPWQVECRGQGMYRERVALDINYIRDINLATDVATIARTALVPLKMSGK